MFLLSRFLLSRFLLSRSQSSPLLRARFAPFALLRSPPLTTGAR